jgi:hypothetical protein
MSEETASGAQAQGAASDKKAGDQTTTTTTTGATQDTTAKAVDKTALGADAGAAAGAAVGDKAADDKAQQQSAADWRAKLSKGDEKVLKRLERYASEADVANALIHAQDRIAKGIKPELAKDATAEQVTEYRKALGIPEKPEEYKVELANGRVIGDEDRPLVDQFLKDMHAAHTPPAQVTAMLESYYAIQDKQVEAREDADIDQKVACTTELKEAYGPEHKENMRAVNGLLDTLPAGVGDAMREARMADGTLLFNHAPLVRAMVQLAKDLNPAATVVPGAAGNAAKSLGEQIAEFNAIQATRDLTPAENKRHLELIEAQERLTNSGRKAA